MNKDKHELFNELKEQAKNLPYDETAKLDALTRRAEMVIRNVFGQKNKYLGDLEGISFYPMSYPATLAEKQQAWIEGQHGLVNLIETMQEELKLFQSTERPTASQEKVRKQSRQIFIVHGHDEPMKNQLEIFLAELGLETIVLHRKADEGLTVIEKFEKHSDVGYAFILLTPDDIAYAKSEEAKPDAERSKEHRARQNVIFEFGYFVAKLGRNRVCCLYKEGVTLPTDVSGIIYKKVLNAVEEAAFSILKDLKAVGYEVSP
jgi:predicted nucleotide-binding protein